MLRRASDDAARQAAGATAALSTALSATKPAAAADALAQLEAFDALRSAKAYRATGELLANVTSRAAMPAGLAATIASRFAPAEVACRSVTLHGGAPGTLCIETTPAALVGTAGDALRIVIFSALVALLLGAVAGHLLARGISASLGRLATVVDEAARERKYSLRAEPMRGEQGRLAASVNELLAQMQERDIVFRRRSVDLEAANKDLESFAYTVSHDLRAPLGSIDGFAQALESDYAPLFDETAKEYLGWIKEGCRHMRDLIEGMLQMSRLTRCEMQHEHVDLSAIARSVADSLQQSDPSRSARFTVRDGVRTIGDERLLRAVVENLMGNAWKFTRHRDETRIEFGVDQTNGHSAYFVRDNGAGFDPSHAAKMFRPFQRLHSSKEFEGTGIGLATVQKILERHGGRAWAEGEVGKGATIYFTTGSSDKNEAV